MRVRGDDPLDLRPAGLSLMEASRLQTKVDKLFRELQDVLLDNLPIDAERNSALTALERERQAVGDLIEKRRRR